MKTQRLSRPACATAARSAAISCSAGACVGGRTVADVIKREEAAQPSFEI